MTFKNAGLCFRWCIIILSISSTTNNESLKVNAIRGWLPEIWCDKQKWMVFFLFFILGQQFYQNTLYKTTQWREKVNKKYRFIFEIRIPCPRSGLHTTLDQSFHSICINARNINKKGPKKLNETYLVQINTTDQLQFMSELIWSIYQLIEFNEL